MFWNVFEDQNLKFGCEFDKQYSIKFDANVINVAIEVDKIGSIIKMYINHASLDCFLESCSKLLNGTNELSEFYDLESESFLKFSYINNPNVYLLNGQFGNSFDELIFKFDVKVDKIIISNFYRFIKDLKDNLLKR